MKGKYFRSQMAYELRYGTYKYMVEDESLAQYAEMWYRVKTLKELNYPIRKYSSIGFQELIEALKAADNTGITSKIINALANYEYFRKLSTLLYYKWRLPNNRSTCHGRY